LLTLFISYASHLKFQLKVLIEGAFSDKGVHTLTNVLIA